MKSFQSWRKVCIRVQFSCVALSHPFIPRKKKYIYIYTYVTSTSAPRTFEFPRYLSALGYAAETINIFCASFRAAEMSELSFLCGRKIGEIHADSGGIKGGMGAFVPPVEGSAPPLAPQSEEKNGQNQPFSAIFWIFAPWEMYFAPSMPPTKNFLVPPLHAEKYWLFPSYWKVHWNLNVRAVH